MTYSPIIVFNPTGLTDDQVTQIKKALDAAYRAGYETAKEFYQLKFNTTETTKNPDTGLTWSTPGYQYGVVQTDCTHGVDKGTYPTVVNNFADTEGTFADTRNTYAGCCDHTFLTPENKAKGICGLCGISFDEWHG